nr:hypothetical protein Iba_scaffold36700CG0020 [Ipomoea batatas]GMD21310.1 hypothetical protein Iba_chr08aCG0030 [Ipomoea batatas]GMD22889.1 hypothetical protein Iba_chr08bCG0040 [Ipomoea batatas]GMD56030.1 hypothetical protein Iba_chr11dCG13690 [Ipomoea batatas]GME04215.1 hypothetical protein Iba_scaffold1536CG1740 [Ipomoea batatas]
MIRLSNLIFFPGSSSRMLAGPKTAKVFSTAAIQLPRMEIIWMPELRQMSIYTISYIIISWVQISLKISYAGKIQITPNI